MRRSSCGVMFGFAAVVVGCGSQTVQGAQGFAADGGRADDAAPPVDAAARDVVSADVPSAPDVVHVPSGSSCEDAIPVPAAGRVTIAPPEGVTESSPAFAGNPVVSGVAWRRWIRITVPPRAFVEARTERQGGVVPFNMFGFTRCTADGWAARHRDETSTIGWPNVSDAPSDLYVVLTAERPWPMGTALDLSAGSIAPNGFCATPTAVSDGTTLHGEVLRAAGDGANQCATPSALIWRRPALYYRAHVLTGETLFASRRSSRPVSTDFVGFLHVQETCGDVACLATSSFGLDGWQRTSLAWTNEGPSRDVLVSVQCISGHETTDATTTFRVVAPASNVRCEAAAPLPFGAQVEVNLASAPRSPLPCGVPEMRAAAFYTITVPAMGTVEVSATALEGSRDVLRVQLMDGCGRDVCLAQGQTAVRGPAVAAYTAGAEASTLTVAVTGDHGDGRAPILARVVARLRP